MAEDKEGYNEEYNFDELDKEVGLGDILKDDNQGIIKFIKNILFILALVVIGLAVFYGSFKLGERIFLIEREDKDIYASEAVIPVEEPSVSSDQTSATNKKSEIVAPATQPTPVPAKISEVKPEPQKAPIVEPKPEPKKVEQPKKVETKPAEKTVVKPTEKKIEAAPVTKPAPIAKVAATKTPEKKVIKPATPISVPAPVKPAAAPAETQVKATETPAQSAEQPAKKYFVSVGFFSVLDNAKLLQNKLSAKNIMSNIVTETTAKGVGYRVICGEFTSVTDVQNNMRQLRALGEAPFSFAK